jgi:uncharacterized membrane protein YphA (DoxX/SURF4 family)
MPELDVMTWVSLALGFVMVGLAIVTGRVGPGERPWTRDPANWTGLAARLALGGALLMAGLAKVGQLSQSVSDVAQYQILPNYTLVRIVGYALPIGELILGALILAGVFSRWTAALGGLLMLVYTVAIISLWARGIWMDCGCFGTSEAIVASDAKKKYAIDIVRDLLLVAAAAWLVWRPRSRPSLDQWLFPPLAAEPSPPGPPKRR